MFIGYVCIQGDIRVLRIRPQGRVLILRERKAKSALIARDTLYLTNPLMAPPMPGTFIRISYDDDY